METRNRSQRTNSQSTFNTLFGHHHRDRGFLGLEAILPDLDIVGRAVTVGEAIKFRLPEGQGGSRRGGIMSATVLHMPKTTQSLYPRSYNIRTQDRVDMSIDLDYHTAWWVFRRGKWYPGDHPNPPPPDAYPGEDENEAEEDAPGGDDDGAAGGDQL